MSAAHALLAAYATVTLGIFAALATGLGRGRFVLDGAPLSPRLTAALVAIVAVGWPIVIVGLAIGWLLGRVRGSIGDE